MASWFVDFAIDLTISLQLPFWSPHAKKWKQDVKGAVWEVAAGFFTMSLPLTLPLTLPFPYNFRAIDFTIFLQFPSW